MLKRIFEKRNLSVEMTCDRSNSLLCKSLLKSIFNSDAADNQRTEIITRSPQVVLKSVSRSNVIQCNYAPGTRICITKQCDLV